MRSKILIVVFACSFPIIMNAQSEANQNYRDFPIIVTIQFHSLAMPFRDMKSNFSNIGIGLGTEVSLNGKQSWVQQISAMWYHNRNAGNGILIYTQNAWRPTISSDFYAEIKAGVGYLYSFRPVKSYVQTNGKWEPVGRKGKGMLTVPVGVALGQNIYSSDRIYSPFVSYQFMVVSGYNKSVPVVPQTIIQVGSRIHVN
jgi:hypothetical protein